MNEHSPIVFVAPRNFKRGRLIMSRFRVIDLVVFITSTTFSLLAEIIYTTSFKGHASPIVMVLLMLPAVISYVLTLPCGIYHNYFLMMYNAAQFLTRNNGYIWEGIYRNDDPEK